MIDTFAGKFSITQAILEYYYSFVYSFSGVNPSFNLN